jgi:hypothetical protein
MRSRLRIIFGAVRWSILVRSDPTVSHDAGLYVPLYISGRSSCGQESRPRPTRLAGGLLIHVVVAGKGNHCLDAFPSD